MTDTQQPTQTATTLAAKTICIVLKRGRFGNSKSVRDMSQVTVKADKTLLKMNKMLIDSEELKAISKLDGEVDRLLKYKSFSSMFRGGTHLVAVGQVTEVDEMLTRKAEERKALVEAAGKVYIQRRDETMARLDVVHEITDYPTLERFLAAFYFEWSWVTFETPTRLKQISAALFESERAKAAVKLSAVADECQQAMRAGMAKLVAHLAERLSPSTDGKAKKFTKGTIGHFTDFLNTFELRNVTDDSQLGELVTKCRGLMEGVDPKLLQSDDLTRESVAKGLLDIQAALDPLIVDKPNRLIDLSDED